MPVEFKDYYQTLGVSKNSGEDEIRKAFRNLARKYHPDVAKDKVEAEEKFKEINEAYEVLSDPEKRRKYDSLGANWNRQQAPSGRSGSEFHGGQPGEGFEFRFGGTGFSDFFEQFFGGRGGFSGFGQFNEAESGERFARGSRTSFAQKGNDAEGDILVRLEEVMHGSVRPISLQQVNPTTGKAETLSFRVKIPQGVQDGQVIRVTGKGEPGMGGGAAGDLYLRVRLGKHPDFRVRGADLYFDLPVAPWEAVLGSTVQVPTLEAPLSLRVPAGAVHGQQLRVRGHGLPNRSGERGDFYAVLSVEVPSKVSEAERELWEQLAKKSAFNPRKSDRV